jgi:hypothetical protein
LSFGAWALTELDDRLVKLRKQFEELLGKGKMERDTEPIDDFWFTENEDMAWQSTEQEYTKRIATPLPTKQRRRVTSRKVTSSPRLIAQKHVTVKSRLMG